MAAAGDEETLEDIVAELPPDLRAEIEDFARFLRDRHRTSSQRCLDLSWAGGLSEYKQEFTSLELEDEATDWWGSSCS